MPYISCTICNNNFYAKPSHIEKGWGKYCSKQCQFTGQRTGTIFKCYICSKPTYKMVKDQIKSKSGKFFCSKSCQTVWRNSYVYRGEKHGNWNGGTASYRKIMLDSKTPLACKKCGSTDSRTLAVHHKDKNRKNNSISNLMWLCHNCHYLVHHYKDEATGFLVPVA